MFESKDLRFPVLVLCFLGSEDTGFRSSPRVVSVLFGFDGFRGVQDQDGGGGRGERGPGGVDLRHRSGLRRVEDEPGVDTNHLWDRNLTGGVSRKDSTTRRL